MGLKLSAVCIICTNLVMCLDLMVIADNDTRWNSTYLSIIRGLKLKKKLQYYSINNKKELGANYFKESNWKTL